MICRKLLESSFSRARRLRWASRSWTRRFLRFWGESCAMGLRVKIIIPENQVERSFWIAVRKCVQIAGLQLIQLTFDRPQPYVSVMLVATASPPRTALKNSQLIRQSPDERNAISGTGH